MYVVPPTTEARRQFIQRPMASTDFVYQRLCSQNYVVISGLPGVGKTELASQVLRDARENWKVYRGLFWINAASKQSVNYGIWEIARKMNICSLSAMIDNTAGGGPPIDEETIRKAVLHEFNLHDDWLMVFDNLDDVRDLQSFLPNKFGNRHVLITARSDSIFRSSDLKAGHIPLSEMGEDEAQKLFWQEYGQEEQNLQKPLVSELVKTLGLLPLAIVQAADYLWATKEDIAEYINLYSAHSQQLLAWKSNHSNNAVATVMSVSFSKIKSQEASLRLFCLLSFLSPDDIPQDLWVSDERFKDDMLRQTFSQKLRMNDAQRPLLEYGFVRRRSGSLSVHRVVQEVMRGLLENQVDDVVGVLDVLPSTHRNAEYWVKRAIELIDIVYPGIPAQEYSCSHESHPENWSKCGFYNAHAIQIIRHAKEMNIETPSFAKLLFSAGQYQLDFANFKLAQWLLEDSVKLFKRFGSEDDLDAAGATVAFAVIYLKQGDFTKGMEYLEQALRVFNSRLGESCIHAAGVMGNKAIVYGWQGRVDLATVQFNKILKIYEDRYKKNGLKSDNILIAMTVMYMANVWLDYRPWSVWDLIPFLRQGSLRQARRYCKRAVEIFEKEGETESPAGTEAFVILGRCYAALGEVELAAQYHRKALDAYARTVGDSNIYAFPAIIELGKDYSLLGRYENAVQLFEKAIQITAIAFGKDHPQLGPVYMEMGEIASKRQEFKKAAEYFTCSYEILQAKLGNDALPVRQAKAAKGRMERASASHPLSTMTRFTILCLVASIFIALMLLYAPPAVLSRIIESVNLSHSSRQILNIH